MKKKLLIRDISACAIVAMTVTLAACGGKGNSQDAVAAYNAALQDSVMAVRMEIDSCRNSIEREDHNRLTWSRDFTTVANDREVAPYSIYTDFVGKYPPTGTCLMARLAENGQFELIGALIGIRFDQVSVTAVDETVTTDVVAPDQGLNYMADGLNTVMFDGTDADKVGQLIADNELNQITVSYLNGGRPVKAWRMPADYAKMIMATYQYYAALRQINMLRARIPMLERKIQVLQQHIKQDGNAESGAQPEDTAK